MLAPLPLNRRGVETGIPNIVPRPRVMPPPSAALEALIGVICDDTLSQGLNDAPAAQIGAPKQGAKRQP